VTCRRLPTCPSERAWQCSCSSRRWRTVPCAFAAWGRATRRVSLDKCTARSVRPRHDSRQQPRSKADNFRALGRWRHGAAAAAPYALGKTWASEIKEHAPASKARTRRRARAAPTVVLRCNTPAHSGTRSRRAAKGEWSIEGTSPCSRRGVVESQVAAARHKLLPRRTTGSGRGDRVCALPWTRTVL
jgi:hypothetical protein